MIASVKDPQTIYLFNLGYYIHQEYIKMELTIKVEKKNIFKRGQSMQFIFISMI